MEQTTHTAEHSGGDGVNEKEQAPADPSTTNGEAGDPDPNALTQQLTAARNEASENYNRYLRVHADMENYKKRIERTYADLTRNSKKDLLLKLLGVKDNLERALSYGTGSEPGQEESIIQGVRLTEYQLDQLLRSEGVTPLELAGQPFDPQQAEAIGTVIKPEAEDHTVAETVQQGYLYQDEVLRPAKVLVAVRELGETI
jgi:molecular chaperone GrpE